MHSPLANLLVIACALLVACCTAVMGTIAGWTIEATAVSLPAATIIGRYWRLRGAAGVGVLAVVGFYLPALADPQVLSRIEPLTVLTSGLILIAFAWTGSREAELVHRAWQIAGRDALTGLLNRDRFLELLAAEANRDRRTRTSLAVAFIDIDNFKQLNDVQGHWTGDEAIKSVAEVLARDVRDYDGVARLGGDEFAVFYPAVDERGARAAVARLERDLQPIAQRYADVISFSIGAAVFPTPSDAEKMIQAADRLMYEAKRGGKAKTIIRSIE